MQEIVGLVISVALWEEASDSVISHSRNAILLTVVTNRHRLSPVSSQPFEVIHQTPGCVANYINVIFMYSSQHFFQMLLKVNTVFELILHYSICILTFAFRLFAIYMQHRLTAVAYKQKRKTPGL